MTGKDDSEPSLRPLGNSSNTSHDVSLFFIVYVTAPPESMEMTLDGSLCRLWRLLTTSSI